MELAAVDADDPLTTRDLERPAGLGECRREAGPDVGEDLRHGDVLEVDSELPLSGLSQQKQVLGEALQPVDLDLRGADRVGELGRGSRPPDRQLQLGPQQGERGSQLVARVGHERALPLEGPLDPGQQLVQRDPETRDLVGRGRDGQPQGGIARGELRRAAPHRLDRTQRGPGDGVRTEEREQHQQRDPDQQLGAHPAEGLQPVLAGVAHDQHEALAVAGERRGEEPGRLVETGGTAAIEGDRPGCRGGRLSRRQQGLPVEGGCGVHQSSGRGHDLREALAALDEPGPGEVGERRTGSAHRDDQVLRTLPQLEVEVPGQTVRQAQVAEHGDRGQQHRGTGREDEGQPESDGQPPHGPSSARR